MKKTIKAENYRSILLGLIVLGLFAALVIVPRQFRSEAGSQKKAAVKVKSLENYDIRTDESQAGTLLGFRQVAGRSAVNVADIRDQFVAGENQLRRSIPTLKVEYNEDTRTPEVIAPDVSRGRNFMTSPSKANRAEILRNFVGENQNLIGVNANQAADLEVRANYSNPNGDLSYSILGQNIKNIPVFRGEVIAGFTRQGEMFRVINNLAPGLDYDSVSTNFGNPLDAVRIASQNINFELNDAALVRNNAESTDLKSIFGQGDWATTAEKMYFPTEPGVARAAWRVLIWEPSDAYYVIVDAETGTVLWRKNLSEDQTQPATYNVYANSAATLMDVAENPQPITPGPIDPSLGTQGTQLTRENRTLIGNEGVLSFNNLGWITDNTNGTNGFTDGNAVEAGLDIDGTNGVDAPVSGTNRVFSFDYNPPPGIGGNPDPITSTNSRNGAVTQLFYINNRYHDAMYQFGFTEAARNFQNNNFGRGGLANDRVSAEAQDSSGTNNANFATGADGTRGRMQMYRFTQTPNRDGDLDGDVVVHEHTHGLSNRLIGNNSGLTSNRARGMGEGWSDFYGLSLLSQASDPINGIYTTGSYVTFGLDGTRNSYYGIRRFPYAVKAFTGGPGNRPHNPLTFADTNATCDLSDGAFAADTTFAGGCNEVHAQGEVWAVALWEVRAKFVQRLGWNVGNKKVIQLVTDGMKLSPLNPTMIQERDSILAAAQASSNAPDAGADVSDVYTGFAIRGFGFGATDNGTVAVESFALPNATVMTGGITISDAPPGGDGDGFPEPGETIQITIPVTNPGGDTANNVVVTITGGGSVNFGTVAGGATVTRTISYTIPADAQCGSMLTLTFTLTSDLGTQPAVTRSFTLGSPNGGLSENFDGVTAPALPAGWTSVQTTGTGINWVTTTTTPASPPNAAFANDPATVSAAALVSPSIAISSASAQLTFQNKYITESGFDGEVLEFSTDNGTTYTDIITGGGTFVSGGYNGSISTAFMNPIGGRMAWTGTSAGGYITTTVNLPASLNGQSVKFRWRMASDSSVASTGVWVDDVQVISGFTCSTTTTTVSKARADFNGDGKTDYAVFRPSNGVWFVMPNGGGTATGFAFGQSGDKLVPADYDGDGKTDYAVFRAGAWFVAQSMTNTYRSVTFGAATDIPVAGDYTGDGKADFAVYRSGAWFVQNSATNTFTGTQWGGDATDIPIVGDFDGDGKVDLTVRRTTNSPTAGATQYYTLNSATNTPSSVRWGTNQMAQAIGDYDGDGRSDYGVAESRSGVMYWYVLNAQGSTILVNGIPFGQTGDLITAGDYDGDGKTDLSVYRGGAAGAFFYRTAANQTQFGTAFGGSGDVPVARAYQSPLP